MTLTEQSLSRNEVLMGFNGGWGWKDRKYMLSGNNKSGTLELQLTSKQAYDGFMLCDGPFCNKAKECVTLFSPPHVGLGNSKEARYSTMRG